MGCGFHAERIYESVCFQTPAEPTDLIRRIIERADR